MRISRDATRHLPDEMVERLAAWAEASGCRLVVLFGSSAKIDVPGPGDVDLAVWFSEMPKPKRRLGIIGELQDICGARRVDAVFLHAHTNPVLRFEIFRGGVPVYEARPGLFVEEVVRALALYEDALPFRRALGESFRRGEARG